jgi:phosphoadenosine phosphosulfate reductase
VLGGAPLNDVVQEPASPASQAVLRPLPDTHDAREVVRWAVSSFERERRVVVTSLQAGGVVIADMALEFDPEVRIVTIDTGRLPEETLAYLDTLRTVWGRSIEVVLPEPLDVEPFVAANGVNPFYGSVDMRLRCCNLRKVRPLQRVLDGVDCWITGLRREHSPQRSTVAVVERDREHDGIVKVNPLATWSAREVNEYMATRRLPLHPHYAAGYASIGCAPCTRAVQPGEDPRAGRWWWEHGVAKECGMHGRPATALVVERAG